ncbi:MAG: Dihydrolipoyllysine-residue acetyltransferase component of pyruvate dehydrogenase complex [Chlamydiales bacterium]|nr:Dihydrolipoyllysine-residue acetyltransferase component of pyruvate dehydrogenase complex [Chlamydiales bacterium]
MTAMPFTVTMPKLSPTMEEGTIAKWHKKEGEFVEADTLLLEITTDKATVEYNALDAGWLRKILLPEGSAARVNDPLAIFTEQESEAFELPSEAPPKKEGPVQREEAISEAPPTTVVSQQPVFAPEPPLEGVFAEVPKGKVRASPLARLLAKKRNLDLTTLQGTGPGGRITSRDLERAQRAGIVTFGRRETPTHPAGHYNEVPLTPMRKVIARRLQESKSFIPHFYVKQSVDAGPMVQQREQLKTLGLKVTFNDMILRASALALREHPGVNTGYNSVNQTIVQFNTVDISVAVTFEGGLITPIIRHADFKNIGELSVEARALAERAREGKLKEHEYKGGSFCISNLGMFGITEFTAVINPPQSAILAIGGISDQPVVKDGKVVPGKQLVLTLSADHRVIDGALAAQFLKTVQMLLENPVSLTI